jgi:hypothetical protein
MYNTPPEILGGSVFSRRRGESSSARSSVRDAWFRALRREKGQLFDAVAFRWETAYAMMSVALDDARAMRARGQLVSARLHLPIISDLLDRLAASLVYCCDALALRSRRIEKAPAVAPLRTRFFRSDTGQSAASWSGILHHVFFDERWRFLNKVRILSGTIQRIDQEFASVAGEISEGASIQPMASWNNLDCLHYDFNTCLREAEVLLKSFLRVLPSEQLPAFAGEVNAAPGPALADMRPGFSSASA